MAKHATFPLDRIRVGERHRRDMGDIEALARSIAEVGLLQPIAVTFDGHLIAGERRLRAVELLGWKTIPYTPIPLNLDQIVRGEFAENTHRKDFTLSEAVAIKRALEPMERAAARQRMASPEKFSEQVKGNALDKIAKATGMHRTTLAKAEAIVDAAAAEPEKYGRFLEKMDRTKRADGVYRQLKIFQQAEQIRAEPPPLPGNGPYRVLTADPGWPYDKRDDDPSKQGVRPYPTENIERICKHDVASIVHDDAILFLWVVNFILVNGFHLPVLRAWGDFKPITLITWNKGRMGTGDRARSQTEHCILAVRGKPIQTCSNQSTWLDAVPEVLDVSRGKHSVKPREFYDLVESLCPAPRYADLFSRYQHNDKWDCHGDEAPRDEEAPPGEAWNDDGDADRVEQVQNQKLADHHEHGESLAGDYEGEHAYRQHEQEQRQEQASPDDDGWPDFPDFLRRAAP
jgi:ParB/RepB/Spo0J family partition protein